MYLTGLIFLLGERIIADVQFRKVTRVGYMRMRGLQEISHKILREETVGPLHFQGLKNATDGYR